MAYKEIILHSLYMPSYFLGAFTEYPQSRKTKKIARLNLPCELRRHVAFQAKGTIFICKGTIFFHNMQI